MIAANHIVTVENVGAMVCLLLGVFLINPSSNLFEKYPGLYRPMRGIYDSEPFWGMLFISIGAICLIFSFFGRTKLAGLIAGCGLISLATLWGYADFTGPGWAVWGMVGLACLAVHQGER